jgi:hypothetical protein
LPECWREYIINSSRAILYLEETFNRLFSIKAPTDNLNNDNEKIGWLLVFLSAKEGTGTSSLCANFAMNIQHEHPDASVVVADLVLAIGSIRPIVGEEGKLNFVTVTDPPSNQTNAEYFCGNLTRPKLWQFQLLHDPGMGTTSYELDRLLKESAR